MYTFIRWRFSRLNSYSQVGPQHRKTNYLSTSLQLFALESLRIGSYSYSWRARARKDTEREVCAGSHRIQFSAKQDHHEIPRVTSDPPAKRYSPLKTGFV